MKYTLIDSMEKVNQEIREKNIKDKEMLIKVKTEEVIEATCDICGEDCMKEIFAPNHVDEEVDKSFEGMELKAHWGYGSEKDGEKWEGIVCENCVDKHLSPLISFLKTPYS